MPSIFTIGHSTLPIGDFLAALEQQEIQLLIDIRTVPRSRHNPQFEAQALRHSLERRGFAYQWMRDLGGLRRSRPDSINTGWRNASFRGYADYMQTPEFATALTRLTALAAQPLAIMCAEAVPWRCHRSLVADALLVRGLTVGDIFVQPGGGSTVKPHTLTRFARVEGSRLWYPPEGPEQLHLPEATGVPSR